LSESWKANSAPRKYFIQTWVWLAISWLRVFSGQVNQFVSDLHDGKFDFAPGLLFPRFFEPLDDGLFEIHLVGEAKSNHAINVLTSDGIQSLPTMIKIWNKHCTLGESTRGKMSRF
jgi:hypothetical protein